MALGGYFGSRLMSNVREDKGYTYGITASLLGRASCANIAIATAEGLTAKADELHFDSPSLRELGHRYYRAYTTIASHR